MSIIACFKNNDPHFPTLPVIECEESRVGQLRLKNTCVDSSAKEYVLSQTAKMCCIAIFIF